jgi:hypothetical protein
MQSRAGRFALLVVLAAAAVALFVVLSDDGSDDGDDGAETVATATGEATATAPAEPPPEVIELRDGAPVGGVKELEYTKGERIRIVVKLDVPQEDVHIHGYDEEVLNPQRTAEFDFQATIEGGFELEAHGPDGDVALAEILVNPA